MNKKKSVIAALTLILLLIGGIWYYEAYKSVVPQIPVTPSATTTPLSQAVPSWLASTKQTSPEVVSIPSSSSVPEKLQGRIAFMQGGEVWVADKDGSNQLQLTHTAGSINKGSNGYFFSFSPNFNYLAYIASVTIDILDVNKNRIIQQITKESLKQFRAISIPAYQTPYVSFQNWVNDNQFVYLAWGLDGPGGGADVYGHLLVDLQKATTTLMQP